MLLLVKIFEETTDIDVLDLLSKMLVYEPDKRILPLDALTHPYFDELRDEGVVFPHGNLMPDLFNFSAFEIKDIEPQNLDILVPQWYRKQTGTFLSDEEQEKFNQGNKFLQLDKRRQEKRKNSSKKYNPV